MWNRFNGLRGSVMWPGVMTLIFCIGCVGCSGSSDGDGTGDTAPGKSMFGDMYATPEPVKSTPVAPQAPTPPPETRATMGAGSVSGKAQDLGNNPVSLPIKTYFLGKEKISFDIQIPHAVRLFQAANGYYPRDAQEFWSEIIVPNQVPLPSLPSGDRYLYDAQSGELLVKRFPPGAEPPADPSLPPGFVAQ